MVGWNLVVLLLVACFRYAFVYGISDCVVHSLDLHAF